MRHGGDVERISLGRGWNTAGAGLHWKGASNGAGRSSQAPNLPAIAEIIPYFNFAPIVGIYARVGTPPAIMQKIAAETTAIVKEPEVVKQLAVVGVEPTGGGPEVFDRALKGEIDRVAKVVKAAGIKVE